MNKKQNSNPKKLYTHFDSLINQIQMYEREDYPLAFVNSNNHKSLYRKRLSQKKTVELVCRTSKESCIIRNCDYLVRAFMGKDGSIKITKFNVCHSKLCKFSEYKSDVELSKEVLHRRLISIQNNTINSNTSTRSHIDSRKINVSDNIDTFKINDSSNNELLQFSFPEKASINIIIPAPIKSVQNSTQNNDIISHNNDTADNLNNYYDSDFEWPQSSFTHLLTNNSINRKEIINKIIDTQKLQSTGTTSQNSSLTIAENDIITDSLEGFMCETCSLNQKGYIRPVYGKKRDYTTILFEDYLNDCIEDLDSISKKVIHILNEKYGVAAVKSAIYRNVSAENINSFCSRLFDSEFERIKEENMIKEVRKKRKENDDFKNMYGEDVITFLDKINSEEAMSTLFK